MVGIRQIIRSKVKNQDLFDLLFHMTVSFKSPSNVNIVNKAVNKGRIIDSEVLCSFFLETQGILNAINPEALHIRSACRVYSENYPLTILLND